MNGSGGSTQLYPTGNGEASRFTALFHDPGLLSKNLQLFSGKREAGKSKMQHNKKEDLRSKSSLSKNYILQRKGLPCVKGAVAKRLRDCAGKVRSILKSEAKTKHFAATTPPPRIRSAPPLTQGRLSLPIKVILF